MGIVMVVVHLYISNVCICMYIGLMCRISVEMQWIVILVCGSGKTRPNVWDTILTVLYTAILTLLCTTRHTRNPMHISLATRVDAQTY